MAKDKIKLEDLRIYKPEEILPQVGDWSWDQACFEPEHQKLFPFHKSFTLQSSEEHPMLADSLTGYKEPEPFKGLYWPTLIFVSADKIIVCIDSNITMENLMEFHDQKWGEREPLTFPDSYKNSFKHKAVWDKIVGPNKYQLKTHSSGIGKEDYKGIEPLGSGGTYNDGGYDWGPKGFFIRDKEWNKIIDLNPDQTLKIINDIILANTQGEQMSLF